MRPRKANGAEAVPQGEVVPWEADGAKNRTPGDEPREADGAKNRTPGDVSREADGTKNRTPGRLCLGRPTGLKTVPEGGSALGGRRG